MRAIKWLALTGAAALLAPFFVLGLFVVMSIAGTILAARALAGVIEWASR